MSESSFSSATDASLIKRFFEINKEIAALTEQVCVLKPEVAILIEIYASGREAMDLNPSAIGQASGISQATSSRCLSYLEQQGRIIRNSHAMDECTSTLTLAPSTSAHLDGIFRKKDHWDLRK